ncbi:MAG: hypothetical protein H7X89_11795 [Rhizobiales bacterium]|nr:hypothetical protein [Hyphomicrobiales bacterium]
MKKNLPGKIFKMKNTGFASFIALTLSAGAAWSADSATGADPYYGFVGHIGVSAGVNYAYELDITSSPDEGTL